MLPIVLATFLDHDLCSPENNSTRRHFVLCGQHRGRVTDVVGYVAWFT